MDNVVTLGFARPRPRRISHLSQRGARILLFTGVRYCREEASSDEGAQPLPLHAPLHCPESRLGLDVAAH